MKANMGTFDKAFRLLLALSIIAMYFFQVISGTLAFILLAFAGVFILTSFIGVCPLYLPFGIRTNFKKNHS
jgi:hypothetical protein